MSSNNKVTLYVINRVVVINAAIKPRQIVLKVRLSNSKVNPFEIWSIFKRNQKNGIPIENDGGK